MQLDGTRFRIRQFLARDYSEEAALLRHVDRVLNKAGCLVTFNGKTFDFPFIRTRMRTSGIRCHIGEAEHVDLLEPARKRWGSVLPNCKLITLESYLCPGRRGDDVSSSEIPQIYHDFVRSGEGALLVPVVRHNALDLATMADILTNLLAYPIEEDSCTSVHPIAKTDDQLKGMLLGKVEGEFIEVTRRFEERQAIQFCVEDLEAKGVDFGVCKEEGKYFVVRRVQPARRVRIRGKALVLRSDTVDPYGNPRGIVRKQLYNFVEWYPGRPRR